MEEARDAQQTVSDREVWRARADAAEAKARNLEKELEASQDVIDQMKRGLALQRIEIHEVKRGGSTLAICFTPHAAREIGAALEQAKKTRVNESFIDWLQLTAEQLAAIADDAERVTENLRDAAQPGQFEPQQAEAAPAQVSQAEAAPPQKIQAEAAAPPRDPIPNLRPAQQTVETSDACKIDEEAIAERLRRLGIVPTEVPREDVAGS